MQFGDFRDTLKAKLAGDESISLADTFDTKHNALTLARFAFAAMVVVSHSFALGGYHAGQDPISTLSGHQVDLGTIAVDGFFIVSGFLVARSYENVQRASVFLFRRAVRVLPAYWLALVLGALVFAPVAWVHEHGSLTGYFNASDTGPWHYITTNFFVTVNQWNVAGLYGHVPYTQAGGVAAVNGSLWTLIFEVKCYVLLAILGGLGLLRYRRLVLALAAFFFAMMLVNHASPHLSINLIPLFFPMWASSLPFFFFTGAAFHLYRRELPMNNRLGVIAVLVTLYTMFTSGYLVLGQLALTYAVLWFCVSFSAQWFETWGDPTYGTYVFAYPIQMLLAEFGYNQRERWPSHLMEVVYIALCVALSTAAGYLSWHLLEKRVLRLKDRWPSRTVKSVAP